MKQRKSTSFYVEALLLTLFFICMTAVLVRMFSAARQESLNARALTDTQQIAQNVSAAFYGSDSAKVFQALLDADFAEDAPTVLTVNENGEQTPDGAYTLTLSLNATSAETGPGQMAQLSVSIRRAADDLELFSAEFLRYLPQ